MAKLVTENLKTHMAKQFVESFDESSNTIYYVFAATGLPFENESSPPVPNTSVYGITNDIYDNILFGKKATASDVKHMIRRINWTNGAVYEKYSHKNLTLSTSNFYVSSEEGGNYHIFKCLDNNGGATVSSQPLFSQTSADDEYYRTSDGYVWKYMYTISSANWAKFATTDYIPIIEDINVTANATSGSLESYIINSAGSNYNAYANGTIKEASVSGNTLLFGLQSSTTTLSANTDFYKNGTIYIRSGTGAGQARNVTEYIVTGDERRVLINPAFTTMPDLTSVWEIAPSINVYGDGDDAKVIATINTSANSIHSIEVVNRGHDYTYAYIVISSNSAHTTVTTANIEPVLSPPGGHGSNIINELYANRAGVSVTFANNENNTIPTTNDYRTIGILKNPLFSNVEITLTTSTASSFTDGETLIHYVPQTTNLLVHTYQYTLSRYQTIVANTNSATSYAVGTEITSGEATNASGQIISTNATANTFYIRLNSGSPVFAANDVLSNGTIHNVVATVVAGTPPIVTTTDGHGFADAQDITFNGLNGDSNLDDDDTPTVYYAKYINATSFSVYTNSGVSNAFEGTGTATAGFVSNGTRYINVNTIAYTHTGLNDAISGRDDANNGFGLIDTSYYSPITLVTKLNGQTVDHTSNTSTFTLTDKTLVPATDVIRAELYTTTESMLEVDYIGRTTAEVSNRQGSILRLRNIRGDFQSGYQVKGLTSNTTATIESIDRSFTTFNQLTEMATQIIDTGSGDKGVANTGFKLDQFVTQDQGTAGYAEGRVYAISNTITRSISSITAANPAVITTTVAHGYSNGQVLDFRSLNGSTFANVVPTYYTETINTTSFYVTSDGALTTRIDNTANTAATSGLVISSGVGAYGTSAYRSFYLSNVKGIFGVSDDASGVVNTFISNTSSNSISNTAFGGTGAQAKITSRIDPSLVDNSGEILYIENITAINRQNDQSEKLRIILEF
jgi:hypothetical protein